VKSSQKDFRSQRYKLPAEAFAIHPKGPEPSPRDIVDKEVWREIVYLPDDVSIRTSNDFGTELKAMIELWGSVVEMGMEEGDSWFRTVLYMADGLQVCTFNSLCGFYGVAATCLRTTVETIMAGTYLQLEKTEKDAIDWQNGRFEITFGKACDRLIKNEKIRALEAFLDLEMGYSVFRQKRDNVEPGWARALYSELSNFAHGRPTHSEGSMWEGSNGPVFVPKSFGRIYAYYLDVCLLLLIAGKLCRPYLKAPDSTKWLFRSPHVKPSKFAKCTFEYIFGS
jgi:hypothetical protein